MVNSRLPNPVLVEFGDRVRQLRIARNLSQERLAELAELHRTYVGSVERGERNVSLVNIIALAQALQVPPDALLRREAPQSSALATASDPAQGSHPQSQEQVSAATSPSWNGGDNIRTREARGRDE